MPHHPRPPNDPALAAAAARLALLRTELDRVVVAIDALEPEHRDALVGQALALWEALDEMDREVEARAAGLDPQ
jgi:hypothetical protein